MHSARIIGLAVGLVLGIVWMWLGFGAAVLTGFLGLVGALIGMVVGAVTTGDVTFVDLWNDLQGRRRPA
jgi:hypothetical protein